MDPVEFLREHAPFNALSPAVLEAAGRSLEVVYFPRGATILRVGGPKNEHMHVLRKGTARLEKDGRLLAVLEDGDPFGYLSLLAGSSPNFDVVAEDDCLVYRLPREVFDVLRGERPFDDYVVKGLAARLRQAEDSEPSPLSGSLTAPARDLAGDVPPMISPTATVQEAAQRMSEHRARAVLVATDPPGILTDDDLRTRVLAVGRGPDVQAGEVATRPLRTVPAETTTFEALVTMLEERIHHLPLVAGGQIVGILTDRDLLRHQVRSPLHVLRRIERHGDGEGVEGYAAEVAGMVEALVWSGADAAHIGRIVATINDALVQRLCRRAEAEMGAPPVPYAWVVFGSEGRREQALLTDQDNALVYLEEAPGAAEYFERLARHVVDNLARASFPPCRGGFMATNWRKPLAEWSGLFSSWIETPQPQALVDAANFFDFRSVHGDLDLEPLYRIIDGAASQQVFLAQLARAALGFRPPAGLFGRLRTDGGVDLKKFGILPIVGLARVYALEATVRERSSLERLRGAAERGTLSFDSADILAQAFRYLTGLRLRHQIAELRRGGQPDNSVDVESLPAADRRNLKETFRAIREMQEAAAFRYRVDLLG